MSQALGRCARSRRPLPDCRLTHKAIDAAMIVRFDHVFSPILNNDLDRTLERFSSAGFVVSSRRSATLPDG